MRVMDIPQVQIEPPRHSLVGQVWVPGSKSLTNRALLISALANGVSTLNGTLASDDTRYMITALREMGVGIDQLDSETIRVRSLGRLVSPTSPLFLGNAGTATRFLTAAAATVNGHVTIDGDEYMRKRPIRPLIDALRALGVDATAATGCPPVLVKGRGGFSGNRVEIDGSLSSQYVSALLMLAPFGSGAVEIVIPGAAIGGRGYIDLTLAIMTHFGAHVTPMGDNRWRVSATGYSGRDYTVEPDASSCTYLWAAEVLTGGKIDLQANQVAMTQPDAKARDYIGMFPNMPPVIDGSQIQDSIPTLVVLAAFNQNPVRFVGIGNLRVKECDRIRALSTGLALIRSGLCEEFYDDLVVYGDPELVCDSPQVAIDTYEDHRIAMSFALMGLRITGIIIKNPRCVAKTFPEYWNVLTKLGVKLFEP